ncbi:serine hydrolase domain-containing protein [Nocardia testacea]|uniref:serine hydrolase domain-containing protein n=1 Tax=Nocardia testacea TaxID=248551 RepID=UPI0033EC74F7
MTVEGHADPAFGAVREVFAANLAAGADLGAAVAVFVDGRAVVDLWGGIADRRTGRAWERDTPCVTFSCTKGLTATAALRVSAETGIGVEEPVTRWWPEFGAAGKEATTLADLLAHRAGLPAFDRPVTVAEAADPRAMADRLAAQRPVWEPGTRHGYHALTFGWLVGEFVRRHTGDSVATYVAEHFGPELCLGIPRVAPARTAFPERSGADRFSVDTAGGGVAARLMRAYEDPDSLIMRGSTNPRPSYSDPAVQAGGWPASGLHTTARALAGFYRDLGAGALLPADILRAAATEQVRGPDEVLMLESAFGLGYMLPAATMRLPGPARAGAFGHPGAGGSLGFTDPERRIAFGFVPNLRRDAFDGDTRAHDLVAAVYDSL